MNTNICGLRSKRFNIGINNINRIHELGEVLVASELENSIFSCLIVLSMNIVTRPFHLGPLFNFL